MDSAKFVSVSPILTVLDLSQALEFYQRALGFGLGWSWGDPPHIASICRDSVEITLTQRTEESGAGVSHIYLGVSGVDDYYSTLEQAGVRILVPIGDRTYGMRDFRIADPSGNELSVGQPIDERSDA